MEITIYGQVYPAVEIAGEYYLDSKTIRTLLGVGLQGIYRMRQSKKLIAYQLNNRLLYKAQDIVDIVAKKSTLTVAPVKPPKQKLKTGEQQ